MKCASGKLNFDTERLAWLKVIELEKANTHMGDVYKCRECLNWHMTSLDSKKPEWVEKEIIKYKNHKILMSRQKMLANERKMIKESQRAKERRLCRDNKQKLQMVAEMNKHIKRSLWRRIKMKLVQII